MSSDIQYGLRLSYDGKAVAGGVAANVDQIKALGEVAKRSGVEATRAFDATAMSAKATAAALRGVPAQFTDIVTAIASGQNPMTVMIQQGGQLKDMFGGVGPAARALGGYITSLVTPFTVAAAAAAALGYGIYRSVKSTEEPVKDLDQALGDLNKAVGTVGKTAREFSMDNLYKEFNKASASARAGIVEQIKFQQTLIETQQLMARQSLAKAVENVGGFVTVDKLQGGVGIETFAQHLGISAKAARDMLPAIQSIHDKTGDAAEFMQRFGVILAGSTKRSAQELVKEIAAVANGSRDAAAAQTKLSEAMQKMQDAGARGQIKIEPKGGRHEKSPLQRMIELGERNLAAARAAEYVAADDDEEATQGAARRAMESARHQAAEEKQIRARTEAIRDALDPQRVLGRQIAEINALRDAGRLSAEEAAAAEDQLREALDKHRGSLGDWIAGAKRATAEYVKSVTDSAGQTQRAWSSTWKRAEDDLTTALSGGRVKVSDFVRHAIAEFQRIAIVQPAMAKLAGFANGAIDKLFGGSGGTAAAQSAAAADAMTSMWAYPSAKGNTFSSPDLHQYVNTVVDRPTYFRFAKGGAVGVMGEVPGESEGIFPLKRDKQGRLGVIAEGAGGGGVTLHYAPIFEIDARGAAVGVGPMLQGVVEAAVQRSRSELLAELDAGGQLAYATGRRR